MTTNDRFAFEDKEGNSLFIVNNFVNLKLKKNNYSYRIGQLFKHKDGSFSFFKDEEEKHIYRKANAWSIPYALLEKLDGDLNIRTEKGIYRISAADARKYGSFLHFKTTGIEKKIYIPLDHWKFKDQPYTGHRI
tara:strand:- start:788 stop:1189 length:402 start_codon:yes stop_codon:yes gene_type:complete